MFRRPAGSATFQFDARRPTRRRSRCLRLSTLAALALTLTGCLSAGSALASQVSRPNVCRARSHRNRLRQAASALTAASVQWTVQGLREVNYDPSANSGGGLWYVWRPAMIDSDMARIASLGANTVRVFLQPDSFGYPNPQPRYLAELSQFIAIAASHGLRVHLTLFDLWSRYTDLAGSERWASAILGPFHADPRVAVVELQNEIDPTNSAAMAWARTMLPVIRQDAGVPVTVSVTGWNSTTALARLVAALGSSQPDFYDQHFYGNLSMAALVFSSAQRIAGTKPVFIGETGYSTNPLNTAAPDIALTVVAHEQAQASFFYWVELIAYNAGLPPVAPWTLYDFAPSKYISPIEQDFGLFRTDGSAKPVVAQITAAFARAARKTTIRGLQRRARRRSRRCRRRKVSVRPARVSRRG
jgi:endo-1,4-beta-mannosidase